MYQSTTRTPYMHQWAIADASQLPLPDSKRRMTDIVCLIVGVLFGLILFIMAVVMINRNNLVKTDYPTDVQGTVCMLDAKDNTTNYPYIFFENVNAPSMKRFCVESCPQSSVTVKCFGGCSITSYPSELSTEYRYICLPTDQSAREQLLQNSGLAHKHNDSKIKGYLLMGFGISLFFSLVWLLVIHFWPRVGVWVATFITALLLVVVSLILFSSSSTTLSNYSWCAIVVGILCILLFLLIVFYAVFHSKQLQIAGRFIQISSQFLGENLDSFIYIPIFIVLSLLFFSLIVFQFMAFTSHSTPTLASGSIYYENNINGFLFFLLIIHAIWGFSFFRDFFNYCISGLICDWYFNHQFVCHQPIKRFFTKNIGSVIGGSFMNAFFYLPSLLVSFLWFSTDCFPCNLLNLMRSDAYVNIYLTGNSFCPSSRQSQYLCYRSRICRENESVISIYSFTARVMMVLIVMLIVYKIAIDNLFGGKMPGYLLLGLFVICLYVTCYFVDIHTVTAQALMICLLCEYDLDERWNYKQMTYCPQKLRNLISDIDPTEQIRRSN